MILIYKNQANEVSIQVTEMVTLTSPYFLFEFSNDDTKDKTYCIAENTSTTTYRSDEFIITETTSPDPLVGEIELKPGIYTVRIFEQEDAENLDVTLTESELKVYNSRVIGTSTTPTQYTGASTNNKVYNNG